MVAGPGSGKTRVLTSRIAHLVHHHGVPSSQILAITFTVKAAQEMRERLFALLGEDIAKGLVAGTFHSLCVSVLRRHIHHLQGFDFDRDFSIYDEDSSTAVLKKLLTEEGGYQGQAGVQVGRAVRSATSQEARVLRGVISQAKSKVGNYGRRVGEGVMLEYSQKMLGTPQLDDHQVAQAVKLGSYFDRYQAELSKNNALDFDDLLAFTVMVLRESPEALEQLRDRFRHVLVDEFQDTNTVQYDLVKIMGGGLNTGIEAATTPVWRQRSVFVVGDPDQAIYSWRGAEVGHMVSTFQKDFPASQLFFLRDNYRSAACILELSQRVISNNTDWERQALRAKLPRANNIQVACLEDDHAEAEFLATCVKQLVEEGAHPPHQIAVLVRTHKQFRLIEQAMAVRGVPYVVVGGTPFWRRTEILDVLAYLRLAVTLRDDVALDRVINTPKRKLGDKTVADLRAYAKSQGLLVSEVLFGRRPPSGPPGTAAAPPPLPSHQELGIGAAAAKSLEAFRGAVWEMRRSVHSVPLGRAVQAIIDLVQYKQYVSDGGCSSNKNDKIEDRLDRLKLLVVAAGDFEPGSLTGLTGEGGWEEGGGHAGRLQLAQGFLNEAALFSGTEEGVGVQGVRLSTIHATKGLEFEAVFMAGCCDHRHPLVHSEALNALELVREERRLFFVGVTRAKQRLVLTYGRQDTMWGEYNRRDTEPSRFLSEAGMGSKEEGTPLPLLGALHRSIATGEDVVAADGSRPGRAQPRQRQQRKGGPRRKGSQQQGRWES